MQRICLKLSCKIDLDLFCLRVYVQRGRYLKFELYLYLLGCMSPDVTVILSRMQNICLKPVQLVGGVVTCVICFIVALDWGGLGRVFGGSLACAWLRFCRGWVGVWFGGFGIWWGFLRRSLCSFCGLRFLFTL